MRDTGGAANVSPSRIGFFVGPETGGKFLSAVPILGTDLLIGQGQYRNETSRKAWDSLRSEPLDDEINGSVYTSGEAYMYG